MKPHSILLATLVLFVVSAALGEPSAPEASPSPAEERAEERPPTVLRSAGSAPAPVATVPIQEEPTEQAQSGGEVPSPPSPDEAAAPAAEEWLDADADEPVSDTDPSALTDFNPVLEPHGHWVEDSTYGTVWVPHAAAVGPDFAPYVSHGHWALTPGGSWVWVSDYPFGWVVFHYGRWVYVPGLGWSWIPGRRYAPAWVVFRTSAYGDSYVGWAPLPPRYVWRGGRAVWLRRIPPAPYVFCSTRWVFHRGVSAHVLRERQRTRVLAARSRQYVPSRPERSARGPSLDEARVSPRERPPTRVDKTRRVPLQRRVAVPEPPRTRPGPARVAPPKPPAPKRDKAKAPAAKPKQTPQEASKRRDSVIPKRAPTKPVRRKR